MFFKRFLCCFSVFFAVFDWFVSVVLRFLSSLFYGLQQFSYGFSYGFRWFFTGFFHGFPCFLMDISGFSYGFFSLDFIFSYEI